MAGGSGSRLWPLSRRLHPKQFLALAHPQRALLQATVQRLHGLGTTQEVAAPCVVCHEEHRFLAADHVIQDVPAFQRSGHLLTSSPP